MWFEQPLLMGVIELGVVVSVPCIPLLGVAYICDISNCRQGTAFGLLGGSHHHSLPGHTGAGVAWGDAWWGRVRQIVRMAGSVRVSCVISAHCRLAASWARHVVIVLSSVKSFSLRRSSTVSPSVRPSMI